MLKILHARLQQYVNKENPDVQPGFRKGRGTRDQIVNDHWKSKRIPEKHLPLLYWLRQSLWLCGSPQSVVSLAKLIFQHNKTSLLAQMVKHLSAMRETWVQPLGQEDPLEKEMAIHSSTIAWKIPWTEEPGRLQSMGWQRVGHDWATSLTFTFWV